MKRAFFSLLVILAAVAGGCNKQSETATTGYGLLIAADPYVPLMRQEADQFTSLYPQVKMDVRGTTTREAIVSLLNDSVHIIVVDRPFNNEETQVAQQASLRVVESKLAEDAVAIIVHKQNPIRHLTAAMVQQIVARTAADWTRIPESHWSGPIDLVLTGRNSGMQELLGKKFFPGSKPIEPTTVLENHRDVIQYVSQHPQSIGCVAASLLTDDTVTVKVVSVRVQSPDGHDQEYLPRQKEIHESLYPFHYSLYLYNAEAKAAIGVGFSAFVLSNFGQKIVQRSGLVPVSIPYRTIQLHAE